MVRRFPVQAETRQQTQNNHISAKNLGNIAVGNIAAGFLACSDERTPVKKNAPASFEAEADFSLVKLCAYGFGAGVMVGATDDIASFAVSMALVAAS